MKKQQKRKRLLELTFDFVNDTHVRQDTGRMSSMALKRRIRQQMLRILEQEGGSEQPNQP